jgi:hypothetical protein
MTALLPRWTFVAPIALAALGALLQNAAAEAKKTSLFDPPYPKVEKGSFTAHVDGEGLRVTKLSAKFEPAVYIPPPDVTNKFFIVNWHIHFEFKDKNDKRYKFFVQKKHPGLSAEGRYDPPLGGSFRAKPGKLFVRLFADDKNGKQVHLITHTFDIHD